MTMFPKMTYRQIAAQYVDSRRTLATPISTKHALQALKSAMPDCALSDQELMTLVAELAVERGRSVDFDIRAERSSGK